MNICLVVPFDNSDKETPIWAVEESSIDFTKETEKAARCTTAFAATELKNYLARTVSGANVIFSAAAIPSFYCIYLEIRHKDSKNCSFTIDPIPGGIKITGEGRTGLLFGAYEFLRLQGWRWFCPGSRGEIAPAVKDSLITPETGVSASPSMYLGRGFDFEGISKDSIELYLWMVRNRMDIASYRSATQGFCEKLGMNLKIAAGHIFENFLHPDIILPSGNTIWEEHRDWYGIPADGIQTKENAMSTQFCVSNAELLDYLGSELVKYIQNNLGSTKAIDVWGFDTWGGICTCPECTKIGNGTDQMLYMCSVLREKLNAARSSDVLKQDVNLLMCGYEGTSTIEAPINPVPANLVEAGDYLVYYPILRCYAHDISDPTCSRNRIYSTSLQNWHQRCPELKMHFGEYYNVSKFEDLPLLFTSHLPEDIRYYYDAGIRGSTYMHIPMINWGIRTITQLLYTQITWDIDTDIESFLSEYYKLWYGPYAEDMRKIYNTIETAWELMASWRAWDKSSVLSQLLAWDDCIPEEPLAVDDHLTDTIGAIESGTRNIDLLRKALASLECVRKKEKDTSAEKAPKDITLAVNPIEAKKLADTAQYEWRLAEDWRGLSYGLHTMEIMTYMCQYHEAMRTSDINAATEAWEAIERISETMESYYWPMTFDYPGPGFECKDALTRTQLRELIRRCRSVRSEK